MNSGFGVPLLGDIADERHDHGAILSKHGVERDFDRKKSPVLAPTAQCVTGTHHAGGKHVSRAEITVPSIWPFKVT